MTKSLAEIAETPERGVNPANGVNFRKGLTRARVGLPVAVSRGHFPTDLPCAREGAKRIVPPSRGSEAYPTPRQTLTQRRRAPSYKN